MTRTLRRIALAGLAAAVASSFTVAAQMKADLKADGKPADPAKAAAACNTVKLTTSMGPIVIALDPAKAPISSENFAKYVKSGHYDGTIFHRVMDGFMIQGGGFTKDMKQKPTQAPIKNEGSNGLKNEPYTIAMARTSDPNSATAQFFINVKDNAMLNYQAGGNPGYAVFGKVTSGQDTVDKIRAVPVGNHPSGHQNVPTTPVTLDKAECQ
jgi:peptidyl-prolyl cis-trans isomerase A (cyclophilin A)